jgi:hypothetical protein
MAIVTNTFQTYQAIGRREDLQNTIYNIAPSDVPFMSMIGRGKAANTLHEWQTDTLAAAANNAQVEGDEYAFGAVTPTVRLSNQTQISRKTVIVSGTQQASNNAGRDGEMSYQLAKASKELKRDMETALTQHVAKAAGSTSAARKLGGMETWLTTNSSRGTSGADPASAGAAPTDGTQRVISETLLKAVIQSVFSAGGDPSVLMVGAFNKGSVSAFTGRTQARQMIDEDRIQGAAHLYASDFGELRVMPNRFQRERSAFVIDKDYWSVAYFRDFRTEEIAKTGDAIKRALLVEYTLVSKNEAASGVIADLTAA